MTDGAWHINQKESLKVWILISPLLTISQPQTTQLDPKRIINKIATRILGLYRDKWYFYRSVQRLIFFILFSLYWLYDSCKLICCLGLLQKKKLIKNKTSKFNSFFWIHFQRKKIKLNNIRHNWTRSFFLLWNKYNSSLCITACIILLFWFDFCRSCWPSFPSLLKL